jgi:hypothetical protein
MINIRFTVQSIRSQKKKQGTRHSDETLKLPDHLKFKSASADTDELRIVKASP